MQKLVIIGTSTTAKTILEFVNKHRLYDVVGFAVDRAYLETDKYCGLPVFATEDLETIIDKQSDRLFVAVQWNRLNADRRKIYEKLKAQGYKFANLVSPYAVVNGTLKGDNCWIADMAVVDFGTEVGNDVFVKVGAMIGNDSNIADHCFIGAKSMVAGQVNIGEQTFVGISATIFDGTSIGKKCIVGACAAVKRDMPDYSLCKVPTGAVELRQYDADTIESKLMFSKNVRK